ncbi:hypothetical protein EV284_3459 [Streptomyces sp. BK022]|uniref:hypothetical protein n=1 Tax=Streptomyces sp. BK022 TaxID=2512123 RepID=UPI00102A32F3|nr:hypothetical protein [Streptomyces sp. BK022]RZU35976.1 hypothetical protein EV284_3459 [Streptomyces sp. BK022]
MNTPLLVTVIAAWVGVLLFMAWTLINVAAERDRLKDELIMERVRRRKIEEESLALVEKVTPLIEKTDWMTGRWHGQFNTLVRMENRRNESVDAARRALWSIPLVAEHIRTSLTFGDHLNVTEYRNGESK